MRLGWLAASLASLAIACGDDSSSTGDDAPPGDSGPVTSCDPPGKFGVPTNTFDLPANGDGIYYMDLQEGLVFDRERGREPHSTHKPETMA